MSVSGAWVTLPDRYVLRGHIANGGMASVWEAHDELLGRDVAVKLLSPHLSADLRARERFEREARAAASVSNHPNVVTIYDVGEHDDQAFIVMELLRGGTVADRLRSGAPPSRETALRWLSEAASALDAAHEHGIVHRDIKPPNMLLDDRDRLAIADFGIARLALDDQLTATGQVLGTAAYISPEQALGEPSTAASDRYALAVVAYELLAGRRPFQAEHFAAQARMHVEDPPPPAGLGAEADAVLERGMAKDPAARWPTATALVAALERSFGAKTAPTAVAPALVAPTEATEALARTAAAAGVPPTAITRHVRPAGRLGRHTAAVLALLAVLAAGALVLLLAPTSGDDPDGGAAQKPKATAEATRSPTATPTAAPKQPASGLDEARKLHNAAFAANNAGDPARALELESAVLKACGNDGPLDPCGFALYEAGRALTALGRPEEAIPLLRDRLERYGDNDSGDVADLLERAEAAVGGSKPGKPGKGRDKGQKDDRGEDD